MKYEIKNRFNGSIIYQADAESFKALIEAAIKANADLQYADLRSADLQYADLRSADLQYADLRYANLQSASLQYANLQYANLQSASLQYANLQYANLQSANLQSANLQYANLQSASLQSANLQYANLQSASLQSASLQYANLQSANSISNEINDESMIVPESGAFDGWKKCRDGILVRVRIPASAKRSNATGRKCRAEFVKVVEVIGATEGISKHNSDIIYRKNETVKADNWNPNRWIECGGGIHFFITRGEAERY